MHILKYIDIQQHKIVSTLIDWAKPPLHIII